MKLSDSEFSVIVDLARQRAYERFISGDEDMFDTWQWLRGVQMQLFEEAEKKEEKK